jgi:hypothetical protein
MADEVPVFCKFCQTALEYYGDSARLSKRAAWCIGCGAMNGRTPRIARRLRRLIAASEGQEKILEALDNHALTELVRGYNPED